MEDQKRIRLIRNRHRHCRLAARGSALAITAVLLAASPGAADVPRAVKSFKHRVVEISSDRENGFGFVVGQRGRTFYVVTAHHVVRSQDVDDVAHDDVSVIFAAERGKSFPATVLSSRLAKPHDLAMLEVTADGLSLPSACQAKERADLSGTEVWFIGRKGKFTIPAVGGEINESRPDENDLMTFDTRSLAQGTSGAPLLDRKGLAGMVLTFDGSTGRFLSAHLMRRVVESWGYPWAFEPCQSIDDPCPSNELGMQFAHIPAGEFAMGSTSGEADEAPVRTVTISRPFCLGRFEVTQAEWQAVMGTNPSRFRGKTRPVESVSWFDVQDFLKRMNHERDSSAYRLPTEAEWEYVARAGRIDGGPDVHRVAWHEHNAGGMTQPVGRLDGNPWGVYDLFGNVWEWLADYHAPYGASPVTDPSGPSRGQYRSVRGGSWQFGEDTLTFSFRNNASPGTPEPDLGFRVVKDIH